MNPENHETRARYEPVASAGSNGRSPSGVAPARGEAFAHRAKNFLFALPASLDAQVKQHPYRTLGVACAVGLGAGVVLSSRILRTVITNAASVALLQLGRAYLLRETAEPR